MFFLMKTYNCSYDISLSNYEKRKEKDIYDDFKQSFFVVESALT